MSRCRIWVDSVRGGTGVVAFEAATPCAAPACQLPLLAFSNPVPGREGVLPHTCSQVPTAGSLRSLHQALALAPPGTNAVPWCRGPNGQPRRHERGEAGESVRHQRAATHPVAMGSRRRWPGGNRARGASGGCGIGYGETPISSAAAGLKGPPQTDWSDQGGDENHQHDRREQAL
jgi:hypothetical protein